MSRTVRISRAFGRLPAFSCVLVFCFLAQQLAGQNFNAKSELTLGITAFHKAKYKEAIEHLERVVALDPQSAAGHFYLGEAFDRAYWEGCNRDCAGPLNQRAIEQFNRAFELDPGTIEALKAIAWRYNRDAQLDEAVHYYRTALAVDANDFESLYNLALVNWRRSYELRQEKRAKLKLVREKPLIHSPSCSAVRKENLGRVQESIKLLKRETVNGQSYDAESYLGLLYWERAEIQCGDQAAHDQDVNAALEWARRACETRRRGHVSTISCISPRCPLPDPPATGELDDCPN